MLAIRQVDCEAVRERDPISKRYGWPVEGEAMVVGAESIVGKCPINRQSVCGCLAGKQWIYRIQSGSC
jgi:hypothetical protein